ncbi:MAG TPA: carbohydrate ABC transporter permease [Ruminococcaceae bacterium]|jgi:raffinose/stachyose/melibiose transport system permease protein|nr:carbohydrate ABC transporter permease [Oscillospiraceae bacterium]
MNKSNRKTGFSTGAQVVIYVFLTFVVLLAILPFLWMIMLSFKTNSQILSNPLSFPTTISLENYRRAIQLLNLGNLYKNTIFIVVVSIAIELCFTFASSFALAKMTFRCKKTRSTLYEFLLLGLAISPFILLFPVYRINTIVHLKEQMGLVMPYVASSVSFNTLLFVGYLKELPSEIDEAAIIDGCNLGQQIIRVIVPMAKPVIATVVVFNVLYIWNEFPFASVILHNTSNYTLALGASFFKGKYNIDYSGMIASSTLMIIPELIFYGIFQKNIVSGMTAGAVKG